MVMAQSAFSIYWNMQLPTPATHPSSLLTASDISQGVNFGTTSFLTSNSASLNSYTGASGDNNAALACRTGPLNKTATGSSYFSFTISAVSGYKFLLQSIALGLRSTNSGPQTWSIYSSVDNFTTPIYTSSLTNNSSWVFQQHSISSSYQEVVAYRIYGFDGVGTAAINIANWRIDDLELSGQVVPATLPVHWLYTDLYLLNNRVMVAWATTWEENNLRYHVERSAEGESFFRIGELTAGFSGNASTEQVYQFWDNNPLPGRSYYRIVQEDKDGSLNFSAVKSIFIAGGTSFSLHRYQVNLFSHRISIACKGVGQTIFQLFTLHGQLLSREFRNLVSGHDELFSIPISAEIKRGSILILSVQQNNKRVASRLIICN